jgi:nitroreductase
VSTRRTLLRFGTGALLVGAGAVTWRAWSQGVFSTGTGPAFDAWNSWSDATPGSDLHLVHAAILAASPHNTQPWRFRIRSGGIDLLSDPGRNIGSIDPFRREMHIGLGCALENLLQAAAAKGMDAKLTLFPDTTDATFIAAIQLERGNAVAAPLYAAIPYRHTNRGAYDTARDVPPSALSALAALGSDLSDVSVRWFTSKSEKTNIAARIVEASQAIVADADQSRDSGAWFRNSWSEIQQKRDGLTIDAQALPTWLRVAAKIGPEVGTEQADRLWLDNTRDIHVATASAFGLLLARNANDNAQRVSGGRLWQRMHLWAQNEGIAMHPLNQMPERADRERSKGAKPQFGSVLEQLVGDSAWQVLMPFRLGYPTVTPLASPRRTVREVLVSTA